MSVDVIEGHGGQAVACPHCAEEHVVKNGNAHGLQRYKCRGCRKTFNVLTGTPLAGLHMKGKWLEQVAVLRDGATLTQAMARLTVARTTALRWRHRFLAAPKAVQAHVLGGITNRRDLLPIRQQRPARRLGTQVPPSRGQGVEARFVERTSSGPGGPRPLRCHGGLHFQCR